MGHNEKYEVADGDLVKVTLVWSGVMSNVDDDGYTLTPNGGGPMNGSFHGDAIKTFEKLMVEPADATIWVDAGGSVWVRHDNWESSTVDAHWYSYPGVWSWVEVCDTARLPLTQLIRVDEVVTLPTVVPVRPKTGPLNNVSAWIYREHEGPMLNLRIETVGVRATTTSQALGLDEAERFLLECLALVRSHRTDGA